MPSVSSRRAIAARIAVCVCAIVCGCSKTEPSSSADTARGASSVSPSATATSELQDWAKQATTGDAAQPAIARASSEPLATPVIHTVD